MFLYKIRFIEVNKMESIAKDIFKIIDLILIKMKGTAYI